MFVTCSFVDVSTIDLCVKQNYMSWSVPQAMKQQRAAAVAIGVVSRSPQNSSDKVMGILFICYACFKAIVSVLNFALPTRVLKKLHTTILANALTDDKTYAGRAFDVVLLVYAVYSMVHGLTLLGYLHPHVSNMWKVYFYLILGMFLVIYYSIVIGTNVPITKSETEYGTYTLYLMVGLLFMMTATLVPYYGRIM